MTRLEAIVKSGGNLHRFYSGCRNFSDMIFALDHCPSSWMGIEKKVDKYFLICEVESTHCTVEITEDVAKVMFKDIGYKYELNNMEAKAAAITDIRHLMKEFEIKKEDL